MVKCSLYLLKEFLPLFVVWQPVHPFPGASTAVEATTIEHKTRHKIITKETIVSWWESTELDTQGGKV